MSIKQKRLIVRVKRFWRKIINADYTNPVNILLAISGAILPFVAFHYVMTGFLLGLLLCISVLWTVDHLPTGTKKLIRDNPIISDFILSTIALWGVGSLFGQGLVLAIGAVFCGIILGWCIPHLQIRTA